MKLMLDKAYMDVKGRSFKDFLRFISDLGQEFVRHEADVTTSRSNMQCIELVSGSYSSIKKWDVKQQLLHLEAVEAGTRKQVQSGRKQWLYL